uniref:Uncharacterized protein n=1 Tax=Hemiselmis andersenii TaxID=464988 RepID=A0A6T8KJ29_HEMAN|mmetsp:Transcript_42861/g.99567  ORF Transcript_42861/g.99567 Transcript_42861/m.99567 type:complete len:378 (+) Transcript_42861:163-1296(+)
MSFDQMRPEKGGMLRSGSNSDFSDSEKSAGPALMRVGDTRFGEVFVRDRLTSDSSLPRTGSPLANPLSLPPQSKFDPNTGKFYRSLTVDSARVPPSVSAVELLGLFSADSELAYSADTHTGTVVSLAGGAFTFTCVGETHVDSNCMYEKVQERLDSLLLGTEEPEVESAMGMSLFPSKGHALVEKDVELVAESCAGLSLFAPANPVKTARNVAADSCGGMTMFSWEDEEEALSGHTTDEEEELEGKQTSVVSSISKVIADTCAGFTFFRSAKEQDFEELTATESAMGLTIYQGNGKRMTNVLAETCGGLTTFSERLADNSYDGESDEDGHYDECQEVAGESVCGWTDFTPGLRALQQRPETYTAEQQWMSDLAFGVH